MKCAKKRAVVNGWKEKTNVELKKIKTLGGQANSD